MSEAIGGIWQMTKDITKSTDPLKQAVDSAFEVKKSQDVAAPVAPTPPATDPAAAADRNAAVEEERKRRAMTGKSNTNPTGGLGLTGSSGAVAKTLLGM